MGEVFKQNGSTLIPKHTSGYVSGGIRINNWTPYVTIAKTKSKDPYEVSTAEAAICAIPQLVDGVEQRNAGFANGVAGT